MSRKTADCQGHLADALVPGLRNYIQAGTPKEFHSAQCGL